MVFEKVATRIAKQLDIDASKINMESRLIEDLKADSLDLVELVMDLEQEYDLEIADEELEGMKTVADIVTFIEQHS